MEAVSHSKLSSSRATTADVETDRPASLTATLHPQGSSHREESTESPSPAFGDGNNKLTAFSLQAPASSALNAQPSATPATESVNGPTSNDEKESILGTELDPVSKCACVHTTSAVATSTTVADTSKLRSGATSRPRDHVHELSPTPTCTQAHSRPPCAPKSATRRRNTPGRTLSAHRKRAKISIKLGEISSSPAPPTPYDPAAYNGSIHAAHAWAHSGHPDLLAAQIFGRPHGEPHVATTLSLTSLIRSPEYHGRSTTPGGAAALAHGIYVAPTRHLPTGSQRSAARVGAPPQPPPRKPNAPFKPPADADEVPESVRMDRDIINTLHVGRRTSSRCAPTPLDAARALASEGSALFTWLLENGPFCRRICRSSACVHG